mgnify:CR=1 FL=1
MRMPGCWNQPCSSQFAEQIVENGIREIRWGQKTIAVGIAVQYRQLVHQSLGGQADITYPSPDNAFERRRYDVILSGSKPGSQHFAYEKRMAARCCVEIVKLALG